MSAHVLLNLLNKFRRRDKMQGLQSILSVFRNKFNKFNNTGARMLDFIKIILKSYFWCDNIWIFTICLTFHNDSRKSL